MNYTNEKLYVLLYFVNEYDQEGGYFAGVFKSRELAVRSIDHVGRHKWEYSWYEVVEVIPNKKYEAGFEESDNQTGEESLNTRENDGI